MAERRTPKAKADPAPRTAAPAARKRAPRGARADQPSAAAAPLEAPVINVDLATILWAVLLVGAFTLRLARLDALPLTLGESSHAFDAFLVADGTVPDRWSGDLASVATAVLFRIFGAGDGMARVVPALAGGALVGAFWWTGRYIGRGAALAAATLIALSPLAVLVSRTGLAFSLGGLLSLLMVVSLFAYLREQRPGNLALLVASLAFAPTVDGVAVATALVVIAFLLVEGAIRGERRIETAFAAFRDDPGQWAIAVAIVAAALTLGLTHFGSSFDRLGLAGFTQWGNMFDVNGDGRFWGLQLSWALAYDWPLTLLGGLGLVLGVRGLLTGGETLPLFRRFVVFWAAIAVFIVAIATRREAGQLLIALIPFALLAGSLIDEAAGNFDWSLPARWWPVPAAALALTAFAMLVLSEWTQDRTSLNQRVFMVLALMAATGLVAGAVPVLGRQAASIPLAFLGVLAAAFLIHSSLSVVLTEGTEFAMEPRATEDVDGLARDIEQLSADGQQLVVDSDLAEPLLWYLRDQPVAFGDPDESTQVFVTAGSPPEGFTARSGPWDVSEGWYPPRIDLLKMWHWLLYRTPFGNLLGTDATVYVAP